MYFIEVTQENIMQAAKIHSESWKESHKDFCSKEFVEQHTIERQKNYLSQEIKQGKIVYMLIDDEPVGIVSVKNNLIENLYVFPEEWGKGYGKKLLQYAIKKCEGTPELWVLSNNKRAFKLYVKQGFFKTGTVKKLSENLSEVEMKHYEIIHLPKEQWKGHPIPITYTTEAYYDVNIAEKQDGFSIDITKKKLEQPVTHSPETSGIMDRLYEDWWENACAWGVVVDGELVAAIQTAPEEWSNRLRVVDIWIAPAYQKQGIGHALMEIAKEQARLERRRAIILETQSCNVNAIGFYLHEGFSLIGMDSCCYTNRDLERREVRLELGYFLERKERLKREQVEIRKETPDGKNFDAFMGMELFPGAMKDIHGKFFEAEVFAQSDNGGAEEYHQNFELMKKQYFPSQW